MTLLRQNSELRADRVWQWSLPAFVTKLPDGRNMNVCPHAGACAKVCYALNGTYRFPNVKAAHQRNLMAVLDNPTMWVREMIEELRHKRHRPSGTPRLDWLDRSHLHPYVAAMLDAGCGAVRIHDAGDFFDEAYLTAWLTIARQVPDVIFYAYSKEVAMLKRYASSMPPNFLVVYSLGGTQDSLLDLTEGGDRHADVFPDAQAIADAGYYSQDANDMLCVLAPSTRIGIPSNNIPAFKKRQGDRTFGEMEAALTRHTKKVFDDAISK